MKILTIIIPAVLVLELLSGCNTAPGLPAEPIPTQTENFEDLLNQAAGQAPFSLLVPNESKLPFEIALERIEVFPREDNQPFVVWQYYRARGTGFRISQSSLTGKAPLKAVGKTTVRGQAGYWVVFNTGERALVWEESGSTLTIGGALEDEDFLRLAEAMTPYDTGAKVIQDNRPANPDASRLVESLVQRGFKLRLTGINPPTAMLAPAEGVAYELGDTNKGKNWLHVHWYPDEPSARQKAKEIIAEPGWKVIDWVAAPHFFRCGVAIALYLGSDEAVLMTLQDQCGPPFAPVAPNPSAQLSSASAAYTNPVVGYPIDYP